MLPNIFTLLNAIAPYAWPMVVLIIVIHFRRPIRNRIESVVEAQLGSNVLKFGQVMSDKLNVEQRLRPMDKPDRLSPQHTGAVANWNNTGNLFWLGHDLMWTVQMALRGAPKERIVHGLKQCHYQLVHLDIKDRGVQMQVKSLLDETLGLPEAALDRQWRVALAEKLSAIISQVGRLAASHQPDFEKD